MADEEFTPEQKMQMLGRIPSTLSDSPDKHYAMQKKIMDSQRDREISNAPYSRQTRYIGESGRPLSDVFAEGTRDTSPDVEHNRQRSQRIRNKLGE